MAKRTPIPPGQRVGLKLNQSERQVLLDLTLLDKELEDRIRETPASEAAVPFTLDELDLLTGHVASESNHTDDKALERKLNRICDKIEALEDRFAEE